MYSVSLQITVGYRDCRGHYVSLGLVREHVTTALVRALTVVANSRTIATTKPVNVKIYNKLVIWIQYYVDKL